MEIGSNIKTITGSLPQGVKLVAVSKTKTNNDILEAYAVGQRIFGENKVQELAQKHEELPKDIEWHFIGHLQTNKVKYIAPFISLIHATDSFKLLKTINKEAEKNDRIIKVLLQFHVAEEKTKFGLSHKDADAILLSKELKTMKNIKIAGIMGMATNSDDEAKIRNEFKQLKSIFDDLKARYFSTEKSFCEISMGMSGDYKIAIEAGSTMVRVGTGVFGERNYPAS